MALSVFPAASGGVTQKVTEFTSTGTFVVPSNCSSVELFLVGGGGGSGGIAATTTCQSGGGGGGAVARRTIPVTPGASYTVTIGAGGAGGASGGSGGGSNGTDTTFGSLLTAFGGGGGAGTSSFSAIGFRGTSGGRPSTSSNENAGAGGGAGGPAYSYSTQYYQPVSPNGIITTATDMQGGLGSQESAGAIAGSGVEGFGGGGGNGRTYYLHIDGGGYSIPNNGVATAGLTNRGGGGGCQNGTSAGVARTGAAGGSGYALITYWS